MQAARLNQLQTIDIPTLQPGLAQPTMMPVDGCWPVAFTVTEGRNTCRLGMLLTKLSHHQWSQG